MSAILKNGTQIVYSKQLLKPPTKCHYDVKMDRFVNAYFQMSAGFVVGSVKPVEMNHPERFQNGEFSGNVAMLNVRKTPSSQVFLFQTIK